MRTEPVSLFSRPVAAVLLLLVITACAADPIAEAEHYLDLSDDPVLAAHALENDLMLVAREIELRLPDSGARERAGTLQSKVAVNYAPYFSALDAFSRSRELFVRGNDVFVAEAPDMEELISLAGQSGYLYWQFRPVHGGIWGDVRGDATLNPDGTRTPHCPLAPVRPQGEGKRRTVYRFGEATGATRTSVC